MINAGHKPLVAGMEFEDSSGTTFIVLSHRAIDWPLAKYNDPDDPCVVDDEGLGDCGRTPVWAVVSQEGVIWTACDEATTGSAFFRLNGMREVNDDRCALAKLNRFRRNWGLPIESSKYLLDSDDYLLNMEVG